MFYSAKTNIEDLKRKKILKNMKRDDEIILPRFVATDEKLAEYRKCLHVIARDNFID